MTNRKKVKRQYKSTYVPKAPSGVRRGRRPGTIIIHHMNPVMVRKLKTGQAASGDELAAELETGGTRLDLNADVIYGAFTRERAFSRSAISSVGDAFDAYCKKHMISVPNIYGFYDFTVAPNEADRCLFLTQQADRGDAIEEIAAAAGLSPRIVKALALGQTLPSAICRVFVAAISAKGWGAAHPVQYKAASWKTGLPPDRATRWDVAEWLVNNGH